MFAMIFHINHSTFIYMNPFYQCRHSWRAISPQWTETEKYSVFLALHFPWPYYLPVCLIVLPTVLTVSLPLCKQHLLSSVNGDRKSFCLQELLLGTFFWETDWQPNHFLNEVLIFLNFLSMSDMRSSYFKRCQLKQEKQFKQYIDPHMLCSH